VVSACMAAIAAAPCNPPPPILTLAVHLWVLGAATQCAHNCINLLNVYSSSSSSSSSAAAAAAA
jgi:hypothetical protein